MHDRQKVPVAKDDRNKFYENNLSGLNFKVQYKELMQNTMRHSRVKTSIVSCSKICCETRLNVEESDPTSRVAQSIMSRISAGHGPDNIVLAAALTQKLNGIEFLKLLEKKHPLTFLDMVGATTRIINGKKIKKCTSQHFNRQMHTRCENQQHLTAQAFIAKLAKVKTQWQIRRKKGTMHAQNRRGCMVALVKALGKLTAKNACSVAMGFAPRTFGVERGKDGRVGAARAPDLGGGGPNGTDVGPLDLKENRLRKRGTLMGPGAQPGHRIPHGNGMAGLISGPQPCIDGLVTEIGESANQVLIYSVP